MKITGFDVKNFKGVRNAKIKFSDNDLARVHTFVGLNESGKTTLLEAMHSFSPDSESELVVENVKSIEEQREQWVPRDKISSFEGEVSITAHILASTKDWMAFRRSLYDELNLECLDEGLKKEFTIRLVHKYENGDYQDSVRNVNLQDFKVKTKRAKNFREPNQEEIKVIGRLIRNKIPSIAYYPTFVFDFPEKIYLTNRNESPKNEFYRQLFQDILDFDGSGFTVKKHILDRIHKEENKGTWEVWFSKYVGTSEEDKVRQVISRAERAVTNVVFSKWNEVFGEDVGNKSIVIDLQYEKGKKIKYEDGSEEEPDKHDAYIRFRIKDGSNIFSVEDRSLGFRWFFSFLLFTQFRIHRENECPTIFLFDEPASNLHATAQKKLLESFPAIAKSPHRLIYSTHSHYMVEPKWLEQAYIVFDEHSVSNKEIIEAGVHDDSTVDVKIIPYRQFVQEQPLKTSYYQPILDTLEVQPSKFDYNIGGLIVEGKYDYYFLRFASMLTEFDIGPIFPARGSGTMGALVSLHRGWGLPVRVLFDGDSGGKDGHKNLRKDFSIIESEFKYLSDLSDEVTEIEDVFNDSDIENLIGANRQHVKTNLNRRIQECLAASSFPTLSEETKKRMRKILDELKLFIS